VVQSPDQPHQRGGEPDDPDDDEEISHAAIVDLRLFTGSEPRLRTLNKFFTATRAEGGRPGTAIGAIRGEWFL
jgi:hypothetical protein